MTLKPDFIDNRDGNILAQALGTVLGVSAGDGLSEGTEPPDQVRIATAFFSPTGFAQIADHLIPVQEVGTCLRLVECDADTPTWYPDELQRRVYDFWETAQQDIWAD